MAVQQLIYQVQLAGTQQVNQSVQQIIDRQKELKTLIASIPEEGTKAYQQLDAEIRKASNGTVTLAQAQRNLVQQYAEGRARVNDFNRSLRQGNAQAGSINDLRNRVIAVNRELDNTARTINGKTNPAYQALAEKSAQLTNELKQAEAESARFQRNVGNYPNLGQAINQTFEQVGQTLVTAFAVTSLINSVKQGFQEIISLGAEFARTRSTLLALNEGANVDSLVDNAKALGASTEFTATQVANLQIAYTKLGFNQGEILDATAATLNLATATGEDLARSAEVAGSTLRAYGLETTETIRLTDIMAKSFATTALDLDKFAEAQKAVGPIARNLNFSIEDTTALLGVLANAGISGSAAGVALRNSLLKVADPASALNTQLRGLDESFANGVNDSTEYIKALQLLQKEGLDLGEVLGISDKRAVAAFSTLINGSKQVETLAESFRNAAGAGQRMADTIRDDIQGDFDVFSSTAEGLALNLFDQLEPAIRFVVQGMTVFVSVLSDLVSAFNFIPGLLPAIIAGTIAYGVALIATRVRILGVTAAEVAASAARKASVAISGLATAATKAYSFALALLSGNLTVVRTAFNALKAALVTNPITAVAVAVGAVVGAVSAWASSTEELTRAEKERLNLQKDLAKANAEEITRSEQAFKAAREAITSNRDISKSIDEINRTYGDYLPNLLTNKSLLEDINKAEQLVNDAIRERIQLQLREQKQFEAQKQNREAVEQFGVAIAKSTGNTIASIEDVVKFSSEQISQFTDEQLNSLFAISATDLPNVTGAIQDRFVGLFTTLRDQSNDVDIARIFQQFIDTANESEDDFTNIISNFNALVSSAVGLEEQLKLIDEVYGKPTEKTAGLTQATGESAKSVSELRKQLEGLRKDQSLQTTREGWQRVQKEINAVNKELEAITGPSQKASNANKKATESIEKRIEALNGLINKEKENAVKAEELSVQSLNNLRQNELEKLQATFSRIDAENAALIKAGVDRSKIEELSAEQRQALTDKVNRDYNARIAKFLQERSDEEQAAIDKATEQTISVIQRNEEEKTLAVEQGYAERRKVVQSQTAVTEQDKQAQSDRLKQLEEQEAAEILLIQIASIEQQLKVADLSNEDKIQLQRDLVAAQREFADLEVEVVRNKEERKADLVRKGVELQKQALAQLKAAFASITGLIQENAQFEIDKLNQLNEKRQEDLDNRIQNTEKELELAIERINASNLTAAQKEEEIKKLKEASANRVETIKKEKEQETKQNEIAVAKQEEIQRKAIEFQKKVAAAEQALASAKIALNAAQTLSNNIKAVSEGAAIPFPANIAAVITIIAAIASGIASISRLTKSSQIQQLETGGYISPSGRVMYAEGGYTRRQRGKGGMHVGPRHTGGGIDINVEGGEFELNREATAMFLPQVAWMNEQGLRKKMGKPYSSSLTGIKMPTFTNLSAVRYAMPKRIFQTGGLVTGNGTEGLSAAFSEVGKRIDQGFGLLAAQMQQVGNQIKDQKVIFSLIENREAEKKLEASEAQSMV